MNEKDQPRFQEMMTSLCETYSKHKTDTLEDVYWFSFKRYDFHDVSKAVGQYLQVGKHFPRPAEIHEIIKSNHLKLKSFENLKLDKPKRVNLAGREKLVSLLKKKPRVHPKKWVLNILNDPNYDCDFGKQSAKKVFNELTSRERKELGVE